MNTALPVEDRELDRSGPMLIHIELALQRLGNDRSLLHDMASFYLEDVPKLLEDLATGLEEQDAEQVTRAAHSIKGLSANFDAERAMRVAKRIEESGKRQDLATAAAALPILREEADLVISALKVQILERNTD